MGYLLVARHGMPARIDYLAPWEATFLQRHHARTASVALLPEAVVPRLTDRV
jgi:hypothetical protein